jgi:Ca2+-binding EF-hand superfamily protein
MSSRGVFKKVTPRNGLSDDEIEELRHAFELFDTKGKGRINPKELISAMQSLGYDLRNPTIYELVVELDTPEAAKNGGVEFNTLLQAINRTLGNKDTREGVRKIFELFVDDPNADIITLPALKKIARDIGEQMSNDDIREMMERASNNGSELSFDEFYQIMSRKAI